MSDPGPNCGSHLWIWPSPRQAGACRQSSCPLQRRPLQRRPLCAWRCRQFSLKLSSLRRHDDGNENVCAVFYHQPAPSPPWSKIFSAPGQHPFQQMPLAPRQVSSGVSAACGGWKMSPPVYAALLRHRRRGFGARFLAHLLPASCDGLSHLQPGSPWPSAASSSALRLPGAWACEFFCG